MNYIGSEPAPAGVVLVGDTNPVGAISFFHAPPDGSYLRLNGQVVSKTTYPDLWIYAQSFLTTDQTLNPGLYRSVDASTFALPKLDGLVIRAQGTLDANHVSAALGVLQADTVGPHTHPASSPTNVALSAAGAGWGASVSTNNIGTVAVTVSANTGTTETRPVNVALVPCVKALRAVLVPSLLLPSPDVQLLDVKDAAASASLDFSVASFSSLYDEFLFVLRNVTPAVNDQVLDIRFSTDGGVSYWSGASDYYQAINIVQASTNNPTTNLTTHGAVSQACSNVLAEGGVSGEVRCFNLGSTTVKKQWTALTGHMRAATSYIAFHGTGLHWMNSGPVLPVTHVRFFCVSGGAIATGRIKMYGVR